MPIRALLRTGGTFLIAAVWSAGAPESPRAVQTPAPAPELWLAPANAPSGPQSPFAIAVASLNGGKPGPASPVFARMTQDPVLGGYALLYLGRAQLADGEPNDAIFSAQQLLKTMPTGYLNEAALWLAADSAEAAKDWSAEIHALEALSALPSGTDPERALLTLGRAQLGAGDRQAAMQTFTKIYYDFALTDAAADAAQEMSRLAASPIAPTRESYTLDLNRAKQLFGARRWSEARKAFDSLKGLAGPEDQSLINLRLAECDYWLRRYASARDALRAYLKDSTNLRVEAEFFYVSSLRETMRADDYAEQVQAFVDRNRDPVLSEEALNDLGSYYIRQDEDAKAAAVFSEMVARFPRGAHVDRATWKAGWWAYRTGEFTTAINLFGNASVTLRRSDYRPSWLYWTAKAQAATGDRAAARATFRQVVTDYRNSYYGREAARALGQLQTTKGPAPSPVSPARRDVPPTIVPGSAPPNAPLVRALLAAGLYDDAVRELRAAQRETGTSPLIEATIAYALNRRGDLRPGITAMRHAYPQFIAEGGEGLPSSILTVIFPVDYWPLIYKFATARSLDPYLMAALIAQESTFDANAKSGANAWGLMQVLPSTGRRYASQLGIRPFRTARLIEPETNIRIGMAFFADLVAKFGDVVPALAAYNAGDDRVARWLAERPNLERDEFVDDIPFPETQNYVKRIIGQAEDYRLLYRRPGPDAMPPHTGIGPDREP